MSIDLSNKNLRNRIDDFHSLTKKPSFSISSDTDVRILFFKRKDKYYGIRTAEKLAYSSRCEFLVTSVVIEKISAHVKNSIVLQDLIAEDCTSDELKQIFLRAKKIKKYLPSIDDVESAYTIVNNSDLNWIFIEDQSKYHSLFWAESESKLFSRCA